MRVIILTGVLFWARWDNAEWRKRASALVYRTTEQNRSRAELSAESCSGCGEFKDQRGPLEENRVEIIHQKRPDAPNEYNNLRLEVLRNLEKTSEPPPSGADWLAGIDPATQTEDWCALALRHQS